MKVNMMNSSTKVNSQSALKGSSNVKLQTEKVSDAVTNQATTEAINDIKRDEDFTMDEPLLENSVEQANKSLKDYNRVIERSVHEVTKTVMYVIKDAKTNEVISEFPPKKIQDMIAKMWEMAGLFVDEKA